MMRFTATILFFVMILIQPVAASEDAGLESPFSLGAGARALGMGSAYTAITNDPSTIYYNPAGLALLEYQKFSGMHATLFEGTKYDFVGWAYPTSPDDGIGVAIMRIGTGDIVRQSDWQAVGTFDYSSTQVLLSYGRAFGPGLSAGLSVKALNQSLSGYSDWAVGADAGMVVGLTSRLDLAVAVRDIIEPTLKLKSSKEEIPRSFAAGLALSDIQLFSNIALNTAVDLVKQADRKLQAHAGAEFLFAEVAAIRSGFDKDNFAFGAGVKIKAIQIDYAYRLMDYVDDSHRFSVTFSLGQGRGERFSGEQRIPPVVPLS
ncbi:MAG: PorV/PorQ family protein, partial [candidate division Zixibacteria bacterium]